MMELVENQMLSDYTLRAKIGRGSTADVWSATKAGDPNGVALKIYAHLQYLDDVAYQMFYQEFEKTKTLHHENILSAKDFLLENDIPVLAFDLFEGCLEKSIKQKKIAHLEAKAVENNPFFSDNEMLEIAYQVASGLSYLHSNNIIHNDIKPANIVYRSLDKQRVQYCIIDFGISLDLKNCAKNTLENKLAASKTVLYTAPEKFDGINTEPKSDIFSLGMVIYELAGGKNIHVAAGEIVKNGGKIVLDQKLDTNPIQQLMGVCLKKNLTDRPSAKEIVDMIQSYRQSKNTNSFAYPIKRNYFSNLIYKLINLIFNK